MRRLVVASACALVLAGAASTAAAQKKYKVALASKPAGAEVRLDDRSGEPVGTTPWEASLPAGSHMVILSLPDHHELVEEIVVAAQRKPQKFSFDLQPIQYGKVEVLAGKGGFGGRVLVDGEPQGEVPASLRLEVGPHQIEVLKTGYRRFERWIEVAEGEPLELRVTLAAADRPERSTARAAARPRTEPLVVAGAGLEVGWRWFRYTEAMTPSARPFDAGRVPLVRVDVELRPLAGRAGAASRAGVGVDAALGFPPSADTSAGDSVDTSWSELVAELRYRHPVDRGVEVGAAAGFGRTAFGFTGALTDEAPIADYRYLRLAAVLGVRRGRVAARAAAAYMAPLSLGPLADRFRAASASGLAAAAGLSVRVRPRLDASLGLGYRRWGWAFTSEPGDAVVASGGSDSYLGVLLGAAYIY